MKRLSKAAEKLIALNVSRWAAATDGSDEHAWYGVSSLAETRRQWRAFAAEVRTVLDAVTTALRDPLAANAAVALEGSGNKLRELAEAHLIADVSSVGRAILGGCMQREGIERARRTWQKQHDEYEKKRADVEKQREAEAARRRLLRSGGRTRSINTRRTASRGGR